MAEQTIECPECGVKIPLGEAVTQQIEEKVRKDFESKYQRKNQELNKREKELDERNKSINDEVNKRLKSTIARIEKEAKKKAKEEVGIEMEDIKAQLEEKDNELEEVKKGELKLRKKMRELESKEKNIELEIARGIDRGLKKVLQETEKRIIEEHRLKDREKDKTIEDMKIKIADLKRRAEAGSQQLQGEVMELELEDLLRKNFPHDNIEPVPKGKKGGDVLQKINDEFGRYCGTILWESKRTKTWSDKWVQKLKDDQRDVKAEIGVIVSIALPKEIRNFTLKNGVWISNLESVIGLATALRSNLVKIANTLLSQEDKQDKMGILYGYLTGPHFKQRVVAIVESFLALQNDLNKEKAAFNRLWAKREKEMQRVVENLTGMYGDMQGIVGSSIPEIEGLDLKAITEGKE